MPHDENNHRTKGEYVCVCVSVFQAVSSGLLKKNIVVSPVAFDVHQLTVPFDVVSMFLALKGEQCKSIAARDEEENSDRSSGVGDTGNSGGSGVGGEEARDMIVGCIRRVYRTAHNFVILSPETTGMG